MNRAQLSKYHVMKSEWATSRRARGLPAEQADLDALQKRSIGRAASSKTFSQGDLDKMVAAFLAETQPANFAAQMKQQDQPEQRLEYVRAACSIAVADMFELGETGLHSHESRQRYIATTTRNVIRKEVSQCTAEELRRVQGVLDKHVARLGERNPTLYASMMAFRAGKAVVKPAAIVLAGAVHSDEEPPF